MDPYEKIETQQLLGVTRGEATISVLEDEIEMAVVVERARIRQLAREEAERIARQFGGHATIAPKTLRDFADLLEKKP